SIRESMKIRSGGSASTAATASWPSRASRRSKSPSFRSLQARMRCWSSLSSTMRILGRLMLPPPDGPLVEPAAPDQLAVVAAALVDVPALAGGQTERACQETSQEPHGEQPPMGSAVHGGLGPGV